MKSETMTKTDLEKEDKKMIKLKRIRPQLWKTNNALSVARWMVIPIVSKKKRY